MFSPQLKQEISEKVQAILQETHHPELPNGEVYFILHIDGAEDWSWANIENNSKCGFRTPGVLMQNMSIAVGQTFRPRPVKEQNHE